MLAALIQMEDVLAINNVAGEEQEKHWKSLSVAEYIGEVPSSHISKKDFSLDGIMCLY